jgi:hypothetical protein
MVGKPTAVLAMIAFVLSGSCAVGVATASPSDPGQCTWVPVAPAVGDVSGVRMVTASINQGSCTLHGIPSTDTTICLSIQGEGTPGACGAKVDSNPAQVHYRYVPGATYVMTARGCVSRFDDPYLLCQTFGPSYFTL